MSFIQVRDLEHGYSAGGLFSKRHRVQVLSGLNLDLHEGQSLCLLGCSGSGESTLARLLMGLESPTGQAERMARSLAIWGRVADPAEVAERIDAVTVADVRAHAEALIRNARPALALYGPVKSAPSRARLAERLAA